PGTPAAFQRLRQAQREPGWKLEVKRAKVVVVGPGNFRQGAGEAYFAYLEAQQELNETEAFQTWFEMSEVGPIWGSSLRLDGIGRKRARGEEVGVGDWTMFGVGVAGDVVWAYRPLTNGAVLANRGIKASGDYYQRAANLIELPKFPHSRGPCFPAGT